MNYTKAELIPVDGITVPTSDSEATLASNGLWVSTVTPDDETQTSQAHIIAMLEWSSYSRQPHTMARLALMASVLGTKVTSVDNPGLGGSKLTAEERGLIAAGNYKTQVASQWAALRHKSIDAETTVFGYSQGAASAAALAAGSPEYVDVQRLILWESVGLVDQSPTRLAESFVREQVDWGAYKKENPEWFSELLRRAGPRTLFETVRHPLAPLAFARGLSRATVIDDIRDAHDKFPDLQVTIMNGEKSRVSPTAYNESLAVTLRKAMGSKAVEHIVFANESHGLEDSLPRFAAGLEYLK